MTLLLDDALKRLESAIILLEGSVARRLEAEKGRGNLETELQIMQDDRARLALELDGALARLRRFETATDDVGRRVRHAMATIRGVLERSGSFEARGG